LVRSESVVDSSLSTLAARTLPLKDISAVGSIDVPATFNLAFHSIGTLSVIVSCGASVASAALRVSIDVTDLRRLGASADELRHDLSNDVNVHYR
jgi:hypothetical protein